LANVAAGVVLALAATVGFEDARASVSCAEAAEANWSVAEKRVWHALTRGEATADTGDFILGPLVSAILTCDDLGERLPDRGVVLNEARLGKLDLDHATIGVRFVCRRCEIDGVSARQSDWRAGLDLSGSRVSGVLDLAQGRFKGNLDLTRLTMARTDDLSTPRIDLTRAVIEGDLKVNESLIAGDVALEDATIEGSFAAKQTTLLNLRMNDTRIGGGAILDGMRAAGSILFAGARIGRGLSLRRAEIADRLFGEGAELGGALRVDSATVRIIQLEGARIDGHLVLSGTRVADTVDLDKARIDGDLWIRSREGAQQSSIGLGPDGDRTTDSDVLTLRNTKIRGRIDIAGAAFGGGLNFDAVRIDEDLWLRRGSRIEGRVVAIFARIGQNLDLSGTALGDFDATGVTIGGELRLGAPGNDRLPAPQWRVGATLTLRNASVSAVVDTAAGTEQTNTSCPPVVARGDAWPGKIDVIGFRYKRFGGLGGGDDERRTRCGWYVNWLARQQPFSLDPYRRLADHLADEGTAIAARRVRWAAKERQLGQAGGLEFWRLFFQKIFVGYGIYSYVIFVWMAAFSAIGALVFSRAPEAKRSPVPLGLVFSLDMLLPFLSFRRAHNDIDLQSSVRFYLYFHKFLGWIFALFFVSALGGLFAV